MIHWKHINEFIEPNWEKVGTEVPPALFWHAKAGAVFGYLRDGELFDHKWVYVCGSHMTTHFSEVNGPESNVMKLDNFRPDTEGKPEAV